MNNKSSNNGGIGFFGLLQVVFIALKVAKVINWSWWLVFIPTWIGVALFIIIFLAIVFYEVLK